jgi:signal transduction histidine kinase
MGLIRESDLNRRDLLPLPWGAEPNLQADPQRLAATSLSATTKTNAFGEGWCLGGMAIEEEQVKYRNTAKRQRMMATSVASFVGLAIALGLWLRHRSRRKTELDADRLASMTHSLKTPLSILKFRCDSLRLGRLSPERADEELLKLGEEVDHLTTIIESGLRVIKGGGAAGPRGLANRGWFEDVADDLRPGFELEGRPLELRLCEVPGKAPLSSLRSSVATLLENALAHGKGRVTLETWQMKRRLCIQVRDEGEGLAPHQVKVLGKPFQRLRSQGQEGFMREGQGLGLSLLVQVAEQEGWGLTFASGPGEGFQATLEIPTAGTRFGA